MQSSPVEATLRILLNSVPFLMGAAVVRQPPGSDGVVASIGRMPWLHDRRLTTLQLPDDTLPSNRAVALDWPVPFQAEWVGAPPRLLIARLVFQGRTVGVLLGTLVSRDPLSPETRAALDLTGELIASAVAGESAYAMAFTAPTSTASEHVSVMRAPAELGRQHVEDGPTSYAARHDRRWYVFAREVAIRDEGDARVREVIVLQVPMANSGEVFGIVTVQTFRAEGFTDQELRLVATVIEAATPSFAHMRRAGRFQPTGTPAPAAAAAETPSALAGPAAAEAAGGPTTTAPTLQPVTAVESPAAVASGPSAAPAAAPTPAAQEPAAPEEPFVPSTTAGKRTGEDVLKDLLRRCAGAGFPTAFLVGVHSGAGALRGELISDGESAREVDYALGITTGKFSIPLDDRYNAIARAVREGRIVPAPTVYEITRPLLELEQAQSLEKLAQR